ncbi:MAG: hypothetical protein ABWY18_19620 [Tardiphaga sp.]
MVDDHDSKSSADIGRPKRPPPTIDLKASGVTERTAVTEAAPTNTPVEPAVADAAPAEPSADPFDSAPSDMPPPAADPVDPEPVAALSRRTPVVVPALAGAVAAAIVSAAAWYAWMANNPPRPETDPAVEQLAARVARVEARPVAAAPAAAPDAAAAARIDALEKSVAALRSELAAAKAQAERAASTVNDLKAQPAGSPVDLAPVNARIGQVERAAGDLKTAVAQQSAKPVDDIALRRVVAASLLDTSVRQSEPYAAALAAVKPLAGAPEPLKTLDGFAATGVPTAAALSRDLLALLPRLAPAPAEASTTGTGFIDRLQAGATRMLHIERTDAAGAGTRAVAARAAAAARSNDVAAARRELLTLSPADRAPVQPWLDKVDARDAALAASRQLAADAMTALSQPKPAP